MTVIFGTLKDVGGQLAQGTVTVASLVTRPAHGSAETVITKERHVLPLRNGAFESPELDPGPVLIEAASGGAFESWEVTLPEDGRHDLATLVESQHVYEPPVVGAAQAAAADAQAARDVAVAARSDAQSARAGAESARDVAVSARDAAVGAADAADASAAAAGVSAGESAASATAAQGHAEDAAGDAATASGARDAAVSAADSAQGSATAAAADADRAEAAAAGVDQVVSDAVGVLAAEVADDVAAAQSARTGAEAARDGAEAARDEAAGMLAHKADLVGGVVPSSQIPAVAMTRPHVVADRAGLLALDVQEGDVGIIPDGPERGSYMLGTGPSTEIGSWKHLVTPEAPVSSVNGQTGVITLGAADVGAATATHTHTVSQITDLPTISNYASPHHLVQRANTGNINVPRTPISPGHAASKGYVDQEVETRATVAEVQARPAMWMWDGTGTWSPPDGAVATDTVLNTATGEIHSIQEVA